MKGAFTTKLYEREIYDPAVRTKSCRRLYGDRRLIDHLDIVNELDGHSGCVNALSWSKSGSLLASGSDDQHLNIHKYQPESSTAQFQLATTVATGHTANIFSVKFMPHSNDRTVVTAAGDSEVRVFDLEHSGEMREASTASAIASEGRRSRRSNIYNGVRYLSDGDTDCRVYRSHGDRVKRIVTESSPYLFLTCSEDGEVRQWDLRQPSSAYPAPRGGRLSSGGPDGSVPPPLISYKRYQLDLNTISCSPSQPHYIALGGAHLHAFLHDRRMAGRDRLREAGKPSRRVSAEEEDLMGQATRCVRKFAPTGRNKMNRSESGHITACKISDARPNEMIASWSGDHIYSFDLVRPDPDEEDALGPLRSSGGTRTKESRDRKRKRRTNNNGSQTSLSQTTRPSSRPRVEELSEAGQDAALRIRYQNGQSEDIPISMDGSGEEGRVMGEKAREAQAIADATVKIRRHLLEPNQRERTTSSRYSYALSQAVVILGTMDEVMRWRYPMEPSPTMVVMQETLRRNRESARRFVQAAGTLSRVLGGKLQTSSGTSPAMISFASVEAKSNDLPPSKREQFGYDFLKAILLWLDSGIGKLIEEFTRPAEMLPTVRAAQRLPIPESEASTEAIDEYLIPYLLRLADDRPIINVEINRFEVDENRQVFASERAAVLAFAAAVKIPFADLSSAVIMAEGEDSIEAQDRKTATTYWAAKVGRGVLFNAAEGVSFGFVSRAFGGPGRAEPAITDSEVGVETVGDGDEEPVVSVEVLDQSGSVVDGVNADDIAPAVRASNGASENGVDDEEMDDEADAGETTTLLGGARVRQPTTEDIEPALDEDMEESSSADEAEADDTSDADEEDGVPNPGIPRFMYASAYERRRMRDKVGAGVPCSASTRVYRGHCNVRTVKDVNYFGLDDEYVVSGSDDGHFFIWDRRTSELVNVLEGDGETVNVIQGHPYETMVAVSGIDHTIKIFSPDARAREVARMGEQIQAADASNFSSLAWPSRLGRRRQSRREAQQPSSEPAVPASTAGDPDDETLVSPTGLASRKRMHDAYRIMNQNDVERQGGNQDAFLTRSMLAELARRIRQHRAGGGGAEGGGEEDLDGLPARVVLGDDCQVQ